MSKKTSLKNKALILKKQNMVFKIWLFESPSCFDFFDLDILVASGFFLTDFLIFSGFLPCHAYFLISPPHNVAWTSSMAHFKANTLGNIFDNDQVADLPPKHHFMSKEAKKWAKCQKKRGKKILQIIFLHLEFIVGKRTKTFSKV